MAQRIFPAPAGAPIKEPRGLANGLARFPGFRNQFPDGFNDDFLLIEDFKHGFSIREDGNSADPVACAPWILDVVDGDNDVAHTIELTNDDISAVLIAKTNNKLDDEMAISYSYEPVKTDKPFSFEVKAQVADEDGVAFFVGLHPRAAGAVATAIDGYAGPAIGFWVKGLASATADSTAVHAITKTSATDETTTNVATGMGDTTMRVFGADYDGIGTVKFYYDGKLVATHTTDIPASTQFLAPTIAIATKLAAQKALKVEYMAFASYRS